MNTRSSRHRLLLVLLPCLAGLPISPHAALAAATPSGYARPDSEIDARVAKLVAESGGRITDASYGTSWKGRTLHLLRLGTEGKPALLVVAGLNALHTVGIDTALGVAARLAADHAELLEAHTVYVIPCADPDTLERLRTAAVKRDSARTIATIDDDRDGRIDEDGPMDLNGDGVITVMRVYNPPPNSGIQPTDIIDPAEPRTTKRPDRMKGESANVAVIVEGMDQDGDGLIAEDGPDGADLNMNFPWKWPEFKDGAGAYALSEPETRDIAQWLVDHNNIVGVLVFGPQDNLVKVPEAGRFDPSGRVPEGIENDDKPYYDEISKLFKEITKMTGAPSSDPAGSLHGWTYAHLGLFSFTTPVWVRPDLIQQEGAPAVRPPAAPPGANAAPAGPTDAEISAFITQFQSASRDERRALFEKLRTMPEAAQERVRAAVFPGGGPGGRAGGGRGPGGFRGRGPGGPGGADATQPPHPASDADDAKWLKYSDEQRHGDGFIPFKPFNHPQLGTVEIGGFVPGFKLNPPDDQLPALIEQQTRFVVTLLDKLPRIATDDPVVEPLGGNLWRITFRIANDGYLPTRSAIGLKARRLPPLRVQIDLPEEAVLSGERLVRIPSLPGAGGSRTVQWVVHGDENSNVNVLVKSVEFGDSTITIPLREHLRKAGPIPEPPKPPEPAAGDSDKPAPDDNKKEPA